jgi:hypothetical protein
MHDKNSAHQIVYRSKAAEGDLEWAIAPIAVIIVLSVSFAIASYLRFL